MNNKPVAWIDPFDLERVPLYDCWVSGEKTKWLDIPLYTHPVKELTDEEVIKIIKRFIGTEPLVHEIEQAILRKAQEK